MIISFLRHGQTEWNAAHRLQGRTDIELTTQARQQLEKHRVPPELGLSRCLSSPLKRATATAAAVWDGPVTTDPRLTELCFVEWEGKTLQNIRAADPVGMAANEDRGLDMTPPGGESPRQVRARLAAFLLMLDRSPAATLAVTHKGVIRAAISLATGWDFMGKPPVKFDWPCLHLFELDREGVFKLTRPNIQLGPR